MSASFHCRVAVLPQYTAAGILSHIGALSQEERQRLANEEQQFAHEVERIEAAHGSAEESADEEAYVDRKWRKIVLQPFGDAWRERCRCACAQMQKLAADPSLHYVT